MNINKAVAMRVSQLALKKNMSPYQLEQKAMIPHSTLFNILAEKHADVKFPQYIVLPLRLIWIF